MAFPVDVSQPFRYPSELLRLVNAVRNAADHDENVWIEWKSELDLTSSLELAHITKNILGFANREPRTAATTAGGYAYLIVGASPGSLNGVKPVDPEQLTSKIRHYVSSEVSWIPEYVGVENRTVLVVIVEPPRNGDSIHALRREIGKYKAGTVFIRRPGQTVQADVDEIAMLQRRVLTRNAEVSLNVAPLIPTIEAQPSFSDLLDNWTETERKRLLEEAQRPQDSNSHSGGSRGFRLAPWAASARFQYESRLDKYLEDCRQLQLDRCIWLYFRHSPAALAVTVNNDTDRNFLSVQVVLTIRDPTVTVFADEFLDVANDDEPELPKPPLIQESTGSADLVRLMPYHFGAPVIQMPKPRPVHGWRPYQASDEARVHFDAFNIRPLETVPMPAVPLLVTPEARTLSVSWRATATNVNGVATGSFAISVAESTLREDWLD
jgi:Putative DNA-binding domain